MKPYEIVVGLEVHVELATQSKIFCGCATTFGAEPNTQTCPVCLGMPGVLPVLNECALEYGIRAALALGCEVQRYSKFDRKNYFYPDLPKGYQISQYDLPLALGGGVEIEVGGEAKRVGLVRIHLEEDAGKLVHGGEGLPDGASYVDVNRCGVPLIEIVSQPDIRSAEEAKAYLEKLRSILKYTGVSDVRLEQGSMRCDVNLSVRPVGATQYGTRTEVKNLSSFRAVTRAIEYEAGRQWDLVQGGGAVVQETRHFDENRGTTTALRSKEEAHDYRYFPEPDLPPVVIVPGRLSDIRAALPELPDARRARYVSQLGLSPYDAAQLTVEKAVADFFEQALDGLLVARGVGGVAAAAAAAAGGAVNAGAVPDQALPDAAKAVANWLTNDLMGVLNEKGREITQTPLTPGHLVGLLRLIDQGMISGKIARDVFPDMVATGAEADAIVRDKGLLQITDTGELARLAIEVIQANPKVVGDWKAGKAASLQFLVGQIMKATRGRANPQVANQVLTEQLRAQTGE